MELLLLIRDRTFVCCESARRGSITLVKADVYNDSHSWSFKLNYLLVINYNYLVLDNSKLFILGTKSTYLN